MTFDSFNLLLQTPGGEYFKGSVVDHLKSGNNVVVYLPDSLKAEVFLNSINETLLNSGISKMYIANAASYNGLPCLAALMAAQPEITRALCKRRFADYFKSGLDETLQVRAIANLDRFPAESLVDIYAELLEANSVLRAHSSPNDPKGLRFLVILSPRFPPFPKMEGVVTLNWWAVITTVDHMTLFAKAINSLKSKPTETMYLWLKSICRGVGDNDPWLINELVNRMPLELSTIADIIKNHPLYQLHFRTSKPQLFYHHEFLYSGISHEFPPPPQDDYHRNLWAQGLLNPGGLCSYHPVILVQSESILKKLVISGQIHVYFPLVEKAKNTIFQIIESRLGEDVWKDYIFNERVREEVLCEIGPLAYHLEHSIKPDDTHLSSLVKQMAHLARAFSQLSHLSAHHMICQYSTLERALKLYHDAEKYLDMS
ncbi:MAG: hypothetical protein LBE38_10860 [Deltaproteobacteria bacterium]|jgi:hypothetical protein|nr:hypothetical protein [Deltaproteobacteria bacterium]